MNVTKTILVIAAISLQSVIGYSQKILLNDDEKSDLLLMLEEEKLARDVYYALGEKWNLRVFDNISSSEERHLSMVKDIAVEYNITIPKTVELNQAGVFANQSLQSLYNQLVSEGNESIVSALKVGAGIEELDIKDLEVAMAHTTNQKLLDLYTPLRNASENHLRAFVKNLSKKDVEYKAQILDNDRFSQILNGSNTKGNCKSGKSKESCKGKSKGKKGCCSAS